ncbi:MAG: NAD(P)H-dependent oxidoreductase [Planctomycetia bacterium]|nr:NAD(P)H-dependent oxidoreductase [Planctomycetia bacterium]
MKVLTVIAHPNTDKSFNHAIAQAAIETLKANGHEVVVRDLYADGFDPVLPLGEEKLPAEDLPQVIQDDMALVRQADAILFVHPNWWSAPPAILKGWIDRVLRAGFAYRFSPEGAIPMLGDKSAFIFTTSNTPGEVEDKVYHNPIANFWKTIVFGLCGSRTCCYRNFDSVIMSTPEQRAGWLQEVRDTIARHFPRQA